MLGGSHETQWSRCGSAVEKKHGQPRLQTLAMRRCDVCELLRGKWCAFQMMQKVAGTGKSLRRGGAMKSGESPTSNCPRRIIESTRSGILVD